MFTPRFECCSVHAPLSARSKPARQWGSCDAYEQRGRVNNIIDLFRTGESTFLLPKEGELNSDTYIDITHEALIRNWQLLANKWLPEEERQAKTFLELLQRAQGWQQGRRELLGKLDLAAALEWNTGRNSSGRWAEQYTEDSQALAAVEAYLSASRQEFEAAERLKEQHQAAEARAQAERASARRRHVLLILLTVMLVVAVALAMVAVWQTNVALIARERADAQRQLAKRSAKEADIQSRFAQANAMQAARQRSLAVSLERKAEIAKLQAIRTQQLIQSRELAARSELLISMGKTGEALDTAVKALSIASTSEARSAMARVLSQSVPDDRAGRRYVRVFSPDRRLFITVGNGNNVDVWRAEMGALLETLRGHQNQVYSAVFSPDGERVVTASADHTAIIWNIRRAQEIGLHLMHMGHVYSAAFSPDGLRVATASADTTARLWNASTGQLIATLEGHTAAVNVAVFSPDAKLVASASNDHTARIWDVSTGRLIANLLGHQGAVYDVAVSPDGLRVASASADQTACVWAVRTGQLISRLRQSAPVYTVAFSFDGSRLVTGNADGTAGLWNPITGQLIAA
jgi:hypothetical protein